MHNAAVGLPSSVGAVFGIVVTFPCRIFVLVVDLHAPNHPPPGPD